MWYYNYHDIEVVKHRKIIDNIMEMCYNVVSEN